MIIINLILTNTANNNLEEVKIETKAKNFMVMEITKFRVLKFDQLNGQVER